MTASDSLLPEDYLPLLDEINRIVIASGIPLEGNIFYYHQERNPGRGNVYDYFLGKRQNIAAAAQASSRMLEIGFNAGHSALLSLANGVEYHGVDICQHAYTQPAADYLKTIFGERFHFYKGDSVHTLPMMRVSQPQLRFDLLHIDGHHGIQFCTTDTYNALMMAEADSWLLIDDTDMPDIGKFHETAIKNGLIDRVTPDGWIDNPHHSIGRVRWAG